MQQVNVILNETDPRQVEKIIAAIEMIKGVRYVIKENDAEDAPRERMRAVIDEEPLIPPRPQADKAPAPKRNPTIPGGSSQQFFINEVISWAVRKQILHLQDVKSWAPEEIVSNALALFEKMPPDMQKMIGEKVASNG